MLIFSGYLHNAKYGLEARIFLTWITSCLGLAIIPLSTLRSTGRRIPSCTRYRLLSRFNVHCSDLIYPDYDVENSIGILIHEPIAI